MFNFNKTAFFQGVYKNINTEDPDTGSQLKYPGTVNQYTHGSGSNIWSNLSNLIGSDLGTYSATSIEADNGGNDGFSYRVELTNFGFSIPTGKTITGLKIHMTYGVTKHPTADVAFSQVAQFIVNGTKTGTNRGNYTIYLSDNDFFPTLFNLGTETDLWGLTPTPVDVNSSNFGFAFQFENDGQPPRDADIRIHGVGIEIFYE